MYRYEYIATFISAFSVTTYTYILEGCRVHSGKNIKITYIQVAINSLPLLKVFFYFQSIYVKNAKENDHKSDDCNGECSLYMCMYLCIYVCRNVSIAI